jgi:hypothetical protein
MTEKTYNLIQAVGPWIAGITSIVGLVALFLF